MDYKILNELLKLCDCPDDFLFPEEVEEEPPVQTVRPSLKGSHFLKVPQDDWQRFNDPLTGNSPWFALEYNDEICHSRNRIHRYSRTSRFKFTLFQLLGLNGDVTYGLIDMVAQHPNLKTSPCKIWNSVRSILKEKGLRKFYNRIPLLIRHVAGLKVVGITDDKLTRMMDIFVKISYQFDNGKKKDWGLSYFLNMRFVSLSLMEKFDITYPYAVPFARTARKRRYLAALFEDFKIIY